MASITTGIGLISGINTAQLIDGLISLESRGKFRLQERIAILQTQRTALLDINARLLNMKTAARAFRFDKVFQSTLATSSNPLALTASASKTAQPGNYQFIVKQLAATSQQLSKGFADKTTTPLGMTSLSFEFGRGQLNADRSLEQLNGGAGVQRGKIVITDKSGAQASLDLTDVTTLNEALERINNNPAISVTAAVAGDRLTITDTSGGGGALTVANATGYTTASDLGIAGSSAGTTLTGTVINSVGAPTSLASLNDGTGVLVRNNVADIRIIARDGAAIDVDFGRINAPITSATLLSALNNGLGITIGADENNKDIKFIDRDGNTHEVNLTGVTTVGGVINRVTTETAGRILIEVGSDGKHFTVTDTVGGTGPLKVQGAGVNGTTTAQQLGILNETGVEADTLVGQVISNTITNPAASTVGEIIDRINSAEGNDGRIIASIAGDGVSLLITDTTGGVQNLRIQSTAGNPHAAGMLGILTSEDGEAASTIQGQRLIAGLGSVLVRSLNGGGGLGEATTLQITDRTGVAFSIGNLDSYATLHDMIAAINSAATDAGAAISVSLNNVGNGLAVTDTSGGSGNLTIAGDAASALGIEADAASNSVRGSNLQLRYVSQASRLSDLNYGRGVAAGTFRITDGMGESAVVTIHPDMNSLYDVILAINSRGLAVKARVNDNGDGLLIEADLAPGQTPFAPIKVAAVSGSTAKDLNIIGSSSSVEDASIDGSYERVVALEESDSLTNVMQKINAAGIPLSASIINAGSGATPYRLNFTSAIGGRWGEMIIDSGAVDLGLNVTTRGQDAKVFFGSSVEQGFLVTSSNNTVSDIVDGVTINLLAAGNDPVQVSVQRDTASIVDAVKQLVTTFNDAIGRINQYDFFDVETKTKGPLLSNPTTARLREALHRTVQSRAQGVDTQFQFLRQVDVTIGQKGALSFDEAKFMQAYENDPQAVENLFAAFESTTTTAAQEIAPGVTIPASATAAQVITKRGLGDIFDGLLDALTNSINGAVTLADRNFKDRIDATNKRISEFDVRLEARRKRLESQFRAMEAALAKLQGQSGSLSSLSANFALAQSSAR